MKKLEKFDKNFKKLVNDYLTVLLTAVITFLISAIVTSNTILLAIVVIVGIAGGAILIIACELKEFVMRKLTELLEEE